MSAHITTVLVSPLLVFAAALASAAPAGAAGLFRTECLAVLHGFAGGDPVVLRSQSVEYEATPRGYGHSYATMEIGPYSLIAGIEISQPMGSRRMAPTLSVNLFKAHPINGKIAHTKIQGLELETRSPDHPLSVHQTENLSFFHSGRLFGGIEYSCSVRGVQATASWSYP